MGPDLHLTEGGAGESEELERKNHPLQKELIAATAAKDHHTVCRVPIGAIL
jgi:hypothetical protein